MERQKLLALILVPTRVGMILPLQAADTVTQTCPHTRGDDPLPGSAEIDMSDLSPHAWG